MFCMELALARSFCMELALARSVSLKVIILGTGKLVRVRLH